jgi:hypothetical protein
MFFDGYIAAPPTVTVFSFMLCAKEGAVAPDTSAITATAESKLIFFNMTFS